MKTSSRLLALALAGCTLALAGAAYAVDTRTSAASAGAKAGASGDAAQMPYAVEDFSYPNAEKILAEKNLKLKRGDGNITLAECGSSPDLLQFIGRDRDDFCFRVKGAKGYLSLEVPAVTGVQTKDHTAHVAMTVDGKTKSYDVAKNAWKGIGETTDPAGREHVLVEIVTGK
ncbi:hypothetical protein [Streptomyces abikoensis]|uniref:hypothetical protein n=1 Tax=Streptomyces abikoensis TaxID=97398 RepID=UPI00167593B3|nr:hypothetical protein [Streptomyces abikoensis]GGP51557.1 hypothetical protein GCM10010214_25790 [Streptomyces abikoensis]